MGFVEEARLLKRHVRGVLPKETTKIDEAILGIMDGDDMAFLKAFKHKSS